MFKWGLSTSRSRGRVGCDIARGWFSSKHLDHMESIQKTLDICFFSTMVQFSECNVQSCRLVVKIVPHAHGIVSLYLLINIIVSLCNIVYILHSCITQLE